MEVTCPHCASPLSPDAVACPDCGSRRAIVPLATGNVGIFPENIAAALAYVTVIPPILFLLIEPYRRNRFVRFHSLQCLLLWLAIVVVAAALRLVQPVIFLIPTLGYLVFLVLAMIAILAAVLLWLVLVIKALQGEALKVPLVGALAERQAAIGES